ncbi:helix-turn-helix domain-containing protein [Actinoplanes sp. GCM10030250]|uniref:helix-turn-helix domain-containing protein n=1 Tax=Actinoplanes sp. GCM10030250 TaxID=3273376 RepID=UPI00361ADB21
MDPAARRRPDSAGRMSRSAEAESGSTGQAVPPDPSVLLYTAEQAAALLQISPWWLRRKATARQVPCTFIGRHLRFSTADLEHLIRAGAHPTTSRDGHSTPDQRA